jgi:DNA-binding LacI/PurR family transcriptional regulator
MAENTDWRTARRVTLEDVARRAEVSRALVSIVMRNAPGASAATRERVLAAARELGYRPDLRARSLAGQKSRLLGVMFGVDIGVFQFDLLDGLYAAAEERGLSLILTASTRERDEHRAAQSLHDFRFDALIMLGPHTAEPVLAGTVPLVVVGWHVEHPAVDSVRTSDEHGMRLAVEHLVQLGHRRIAHIDGGSTLIAGARRQGYTKAMRAQGLGRYVRIVAGGQTLLDGQHAASTLLGDGELPTGIVAYNDDIAVGAMGLLASRGVDVPQDLSVVGFDDSEAAELSPIGLTSVAQEPNLLARLAVERMIDRIESRELDHRDIVLEPELRVRASSRAMSATMS